MKIGYDFNKYKFPEDWNKIKLKEILYLIERPVKMDDNEKYQLVTVKRNYGGVQERGILNGKDILVKSQFVINEGDFLISKRQIAHGAFGIVPKELNNAIVSNEYNVFKANENLSLKFFNYYSQLPFMKRNFYISSDGVHIEKLLFKTNDWLNRYVVIPPSKEQEKITQIISTLDLVIEKQEQLIEKKKEFKKGLMQRLLSGEVRFKEFKDEWNNKTLANYIIPISRECDKPNEGYWRLRLRSHCKGTFHEFVEDPSTVSMDKLYKVKCNDLIVNITFAWEHAIAVANSMDEDKLVSHRFPTYEFKGNAYPLFFKYYILQLKFKNMLVNISPGGAGRNRVMNKKDFLKLMVKVPSYDEQVRIAEVLIESDKEIELLEKELEALKLQKKGLMQRLLTGEVRVKV